MKTREDAVSFLYQSQEKFARDAAPIFKAMGWEWCDWHSSDLGKTCVPDANMISATVASLIWACIKDGGQNIASTGRIEVQIRKNDRQEWHASITLVATSERSW